MLAVRAAPLFADTANANVPLPDPDATPVAVTHDALLDAVHSHPAAAVTVACPVPPLAPKDEGASETANVQPPVACDTVTARPAIVTVVERAAPEFAATASVTDPPPDPEAPWVTDTHGAALCAVHAHPSGPCTEIRASPPDAGTETLIGSTANEHAAPCWVMSTRPWFTTTAPVRADEAGLGDAVNATVPGPWPFVPLVTAIHAAWLVAVHEHSRLVLTEIDPLPPSPGTLRPDPVKLTAHLVEDGPVTFVEVDRHPSEADVASVASRKRAMGGAASEVVRGTSDLDRPL